MILHGFNLVAKNPPFTPASLGFADDAAAFLASEGFSTMRLGMVYQAIEPQPIVHDDGCIETVLDTARDLGRHGIFTLLDFHQDDYGSVFGAEGFPAWATLTDGLPNPNLGVGGDYTANPALERAFDNLWANALGPGGVGIQDRYAAALAHVAMLAGPIPSLLGYDIINEPWPGSQWPTCAGPVACRLFDENSLSRSTSA